MKNCLACNTKFKIPPCRRATAKYCSTICQYSQQMKNKATFTICAYCNIKIQIPPSHIKRRRNNFCSMKCGGKYNGRLRKFTGKDNPCWKGGITPLRVAIRTSAAYSEWRTAVFERDNYTCVLCSKRGGELNADHMKSFSQYPELIFELSNGRTLCIGCHRETPNYGGRAIC